MQPLPASPTPERIESISKRLGEEREAGTFPFRSLAGQTR